MRHPLLHGSLIHTVCFLSLLCYFIGMAWNIYSGFRIQKSLTGTRFDELKLQFTTGKTCFKRTTCNTNRNKKNYQLLNILQLSVEKIKHSLSFQAVAWESDRWKISKYQGTYPSTLCLPTSLTGRALLRQHSHVKNN